MEELFEQKLDALHQKREKYIRLKLIKDHLDLALSNKPLDPRLKAKIREISTAHSLRQAHLDYILPKNPNSRLTHTECEALKTAILENFKQQQNEIVCSFKEATGSTIEVAIQAKKTNPLHLLSKIETESFAYRDKLKEYQRILQKCVKFQEENIPAICDSKLTHFQRVLSLNSLKVKLAEAKIHHSIITKDAFSRFPQVSIKMQEMEKQFTGRIKELETLRGQYDECACLEFSEILKSYVQYKTALEKKQKMIQMLRDE